MSYNIDQWKTKKIENLIIPLSELYVSERKDWHPEKPEVLDNGSIIIEGGCGQKIAGLLKGNNLEVKEFNITGEGSGSFMYYVLEHALSKSSGYLEVVLIWEHGDTIEKMIVDNGKITKEKIEL